MILTDEGYIEKENNAWKRYYTLRDRLGSMRAVIDESGNNVQETRYYPFGTYFAESTNQEKQPYKYNGKELDRHFGLDLYDYGARFYDPLIGRFTTPDPLSEKYYSVSPYTYCANNPVNAIDPRGDSIWYTIDQNNITMHVTGKVINQSSDNINVERAAKDIAASIDEVFSGKFEMDGQNYTLSTDIQLVDVGSMSEVLDSDHLFVLADADGKGARGSTSVEEAGRALTINAGDYANDNWFSDRFSSNNTRSAVHEFGHAAGLGHPERESNNDKYRRNLMNQGSSGTRIIPEQRRIMYKRRNTINKGPNSYMGRPYPFLHYREKGKWHTSHINKVGLWHRK